jgi:hypothetical protein
MPMGLSVRYSTDIPGWRKMTINGFRLWLAVVALTLLTVVLTLMTNASGHVK